MLFQAVRKILASEIPERCLGLVGVTAVSLPQCGNSQLHAVLQVFRQLGGEVNGLTAYSDRISDPVALKQDPAENAKARCQVGEVGVAVEVGQFAVQGEGFLGDAGGFGCPLERQSAVPAAARSPGLSRHRH